MSWKNVLNAREKEIIEFQIKFNHRNTQNEIRFIKIYDFFLIMCEENNLQGL